MDYLLLKGNIMKVTRITPMHVQIQYFEMESVW